MYATLWRIICGCNYFLLQWNLFINIYSKKSTYIECRAVKHIQNCQKCQKMSQFWQNFSIFLKKKDRFIKKNTNSKKKTGLIAGKHVNSRRIRAILQNYGFSTLIGNL